MKWTPADTAKLKKLNALKKKKSLESARVPAAGTFTILERGFTDVYEPEILIEGYFPAAGDTRSPAQIAEAQASADKKREVTVTLLREGPGNKFHNNYYKRTALESAKKELESRPKQFFNHAKDIDNPDRDLRDWASSIVETWIDTSEPKAKLKARVKVHDNWLWERAKIAPKELAVSIEGKGNGNSESIEGQPFNAIHEINRVNGVNWVDYPGNAGMGVEVLESDRRKNSKEAKPMLKELVEKLKNLSETERAELFETNPELKEFFILPAAGNDEGTKKQLAELSESVKQMKAASEAQAKALKEQADALKADNTRLANIVEAHELRSKEDAKGKMIEAALKASKLTEKHVTETFRATLANVKEMKVGDKVVTEAEQVKQLIDDREKICIAEKAVVGQEGAGAGGVEVTEKEKGRQFTLNIFGIDPEVAAKSRADQEREAEDRAAKAAAGVSK